MAKKEYKEIITPKEPGGGIKYDTGKLDYSLLPWDVLEQLVVRYTVGKKKYARDSWKLVEDAENRYEAAALRHFAAYKKGIRWDDDPNFADNPSSHLVACGWNILCLIWFELQKIKKENESKTMEKSRNGKK